MKKILILMMVAFSLVVYGEKFPYTSESDRKKNIKRT